MVCAHQGLAPQCASVLRHLLRHHRGQRADRPDPRDPPVPNHVALSDPERGLFARTAGAGAEAVEQ